MKPLFFNTEMVRAILAGRKSVTRRVVKPQPRMVCYDGKLQDSGDDLRDGVPLLVLIAEGHNGELEQIVPPYQPNQTFYVRETWQYAYELDGNEQPIEGTGRYFYAADEGSEPFGFWVNPDGTHRDSIPWRSSIHMPREAARLFLRVTDVRVEKLHEITNDGVKAEGVQSKKKEWERIDFADLWNSTIKPKDLALYGWDADPYVWVIEFEKISKEEALKHDQRGQDSSHE